MVGSVTCGIVLATLLMTGPAYADATWTDQDKVGIQPLAQHARGILRDVLFDYQSMQMEGPVYGGYQVINGAKEYFLTGEINAKNRLGGYVGFDQFILFERADGVRFVFLHSASIQELTLLDFLNSPGIRDQADDYSGYITPQSAAR